jgi:hypothetical protein
LLFQQEFRLVQRFHTLFATLLLLFFYLSCKGFPQFTSFYAHFDSRSTLSVVPCFITID